MRRSSARVLSSFERGSHLEHPERDRVARREVSSRGRSTDNNGENDTRSVGESDLSRGRRSDRKSTKWIQSFYAYRADTRYASMGRYMDTHSEERSKASDFGDRGDVEGGGRANSTVDVDEHAERLSKHLYEQPGTSVLRKGTSSISKPSTFRPLSLSISRRTVFWCGRNGFLPPSS